MLSYGLGLWAGWRYAFGWLLHPTSPVPEVAVHLFVYLLAVHVIVDFVVLFDAADYSGRISSADGYLWARLRRRRDLLSILVRAIAMAVVGGLLGGSSIGSVAFPSLVILGALAGLPALKEQPRHTLLTQVLLLTAYLFVALAASTASDELWLDLWPSTLRQLVVIAAGAVATARVGSLFATWMLELADPTDDTAERQDEKDKQLLHAES